MAWPMVAPAGNAVVLERWERDRARGFLDGVLDPYQRSFFASGTEALAAALVRVLESRPPSRRDVLIPAYACPDLVSAAVFAGGTVVLVDTYPDRWGYDLEDLSRKISVRTAAIVLVDLLGLGDAAKQVVRIARDAGVAVIQDSAQFLPLAASHAWCAEYVVLSFGRGKPVNLFGGGALLSADSGDAARFAAQYGVTKHISETLAWKSAAQLFNRYGRRHGYRLSTWMGLGVGETRYSPLRRVRRLAADFERVLAPAIESYRTRPRAGPRRLLHVDGRDVLTVLAPEDPDRPLLRLPVLTRSASRRAGLMRLFRERGYAASALYGRELSRVSGVPKEAALQVRTPGAREFAARFLTLPAHDDVTEREFEEMGSVLREAARTWK